MKTELIDEFHDDDIHQQKQLVLIVADHDDHEHDDRDVIVHRISAYDEIDDHENADLVADDDDELFLFDHAIDEHDLIDDDVDDVADIIHDMTQQIIDDDDDDELDVNEQFEYDELDVNE